MAGERKLRSRMSFSYSHPNRTDRPQMLEYKLDDDLYEHISLRNQYFSHLVRVRSYTISNILSQCKRKGGYKLLCDQRAVGLVLPTPAETNLTKCRRAWGNISKLALTKFR